MKTIKFEVPKGLGQGCSALLRQSLIETSSSVKPVAFKLDEGNMYKCGEGKIDNMALSSLIADLTFNVSSNVELPIMLEATYHSKLTSSDLCNSNDDVDIVEKDVVLIEEIDSSKECSIKIIIDRNCGYKSHSFNRKDLEKKDLDIKGFNIISSRYSDVRVSMSPPFEDMDSDIVNLEVSSKSGNEGDKINESIDKIIKIFQDLKVSL